MSAPESEPTPPLNRNEDPLTHESGAHPVAAGVGAAGGGATGAVVGLALGGPIGGVIGAVIGAVAGGFGGSAVGESISPTVENESWPGQAEQRRTGLESAEADTGSVMEGGPLEETTPLADALHTHGANLEEAVPTGSGEAAPHEEIALRAWTKFESEGRPDGQDLRHWLEAEQSLAPKNTIV